MKIKGWDKKVPHFKDIPLKNYFESKRKDDYTMSSVHGVKGETYDALMLIVEARTGNNTLTPAFLNTGDISQELMRIGYVAMTRPRKLLVVAMPNVKSRTVHPRFPKEKWDYAII
jgi:ATP-dependent exoDNAse (exonuclease V) beta subunit